MILIVALFILLCLGAFFSAAETATTALSRIDIITLKELHPKAFKVADLMEHHQERLIASLLIGNNIANISASAITAYIMGLYGGVAIAIGTFCLTLLIIIFCEIAPKQIGFLYKHQIALALALPVTFFYKLFYPILRFTLWVTNFVFPFLVRAKGLPKNQEDLAKSLKHMLDLATENNSISYYERDFINNILELNDRTVRQIMVHRKDIFSVDADEKLEDIYPQLAEVTYSRIPVYKDNSENIVGIFYPADVQKLLIGQKGANTAELTVAQLMRAVAFLPDTLLISSLFFHFKQSAGNLAIILDEYGGLAGIVSQEDVLEAVFGKLYDEDEQREELGILKEGDTYIFSGMLSIHEFEQFFDLELEDNPRLATISGYLCDIFGSIPEQGEQIETPHGLFTVRESDGRRIVSLNFEKGLADSSSLR